MSWCKFISYNSLCLKVRAVQLNTEDLFSIDFSYHHHNIGRIYVLLNTGNPTLLLMLNRTWSTFCSSVLRLPWLWKTMSYVNEHLLEMPDEVILKKNPIKMCDFIHLVNYQKSSRMWGPKNIPHLLQK